MSNPDILLFFADPVRHEIDMRPHFELVFREIVKDIKPDFVSETDVGQQVSNGISPDITPPPSRSSRAIPRLSGTSRDPATIPPS